MIMENYQQQTPQPRRRGMSVGTALVLGISGIVITAIIIGGLVALRWLQTTGGVDITITEDGTETVVEVSTDEKDFDWEDVSEETLAGLVGGANLGLMPGSYGQFVDTRDVTGDGQPEGIFTGAGGNAGITFILRDVDGSPRVAQQRDSSGNIQPVALYSIGRAAVSVNYEFLPEQNGYVVMQKKLDQTEEGVDPKGFTCEENGVNVYAWDPSTELFEWNQALTEQYTAQECR
jgi:hypothetical protein